MLGGISCHCSKTGHRKEKFWIFLATQNYCGQCQKYGHSIFKGCPKLRPFKSRSCEKKPSSGEKPRPTSTTFSTIMKEDFVYHISSAIPIHTSSGTKTGILDSGSGITLIKKELVEEILNMRNQYLQRSSFNLKRRRKTRDFRNCGSSYKLTIKIVSRRSQLDL